MANRRKKDGEKKITVRPAKAAHVVVVVPADPAGDVATAPNPSPVEIGVTVLLSAAFVVAVFGVLLFGVWMNPIVSIDGVSATGLDAATGKNASAATTVSPSFDVAVRLRRRWFRLLPDTYTNGTVSVSFAGAGGAVVARGALQDVTLTAFSPSVVSATARAPPTALLAAGELRRGEVRLDVMVSYDRSQVHEPYSPLSHGFRAMCAATALGRGNSTAAAPPAAASCTVVRIPSPNDLSWFQ
uniref:Uncharacterized protein n=1 Tax=Oryza meridionalis TaxID=40149 RepID=A0A0E0EZ62_9ORYZ